MLSLLSMCLCSCGKSLTSRIYTELEKFINHEKLYQNTCRYIYSLKSADIKESGGTTDGQLKVFTCDCKVEERVEYFKDNLTTYQILDERHTAYYYKASDEIRFD